MLLLENVARGMWLARSHLDRQCQLSIDAIGRLAALLVCHFV